MGCNCEKHNAMLKKNIGEEEEEQRSGERERLLPRNNSEDEEEINFILCGIEFSY